MGHDHPFACGTFGSIETIMCSTRTITYTCFEKIGFTKFNFRKECSYILPKI